jgi:hypothetical protein
MLARTEIEIGMSSLLDRMADMRFADGFVPVEQGVFTRAPNRLDCVVRARVIKTARRAPGASR